jgi:hypothetical protein
MSAVDPGDLARVVRALSHGFALERLVDEESAPEAFLGRVLALIFGGLWAELETGPRASATSPATRSPNG